MREIDFTFFTENLSGLPQKPCILFSLHFFGLSSDPKVHTSLLNRQLARPNICSFQAPRHCIALSTSYQVLELVKCR